MVKKISILQIISTHKTSTIFHCQLPWLMADGNLHFCKCQSMLHLRTYAPMYLSYICIYLYLTKPLSVVDHESCMYIFTSISQSCILCRHGYVTLATCVWVCFGLYCSTCLWIAPFPSLPTQDFRPSLISLWLLSRSLATFWWVWLECVSCRGPIQFIIEPCEFGDWTWWQKPVQSLDLPFDDVCNCLKEKTRLANMLLCLVLAFERGVFLANTWNARS